MSKFTYKTKDGVTTGFVPGIGAIVDGQISSDTPINNANLILISSPETADEPAAPAPVEGTASQQNPNQPTSAEQPGNTGVQA